MEPKGKEGRNHCICKILVEIILAYCGCWLCVFMVPLGASFAMKLYEKIAESWKFLSNYTGDEWTS